MSNQEDMTKCGPSVSHVSLAYVHETWLTSGSHSVISPSWLVSIYRICSIYLNFYFHSTLWGLCGHVLLTWTYFFLRNNEHFTTLEKNFDMTPTLYHFNQFIVKSLLGSTKTCHVILQNVQLFEDAEFWWMTH